MSPLPILTLFSIAMAFLETAVVIYLRALLYPGGFDFPLAAMPPDLVLTEIIREFCTLLMLLGAGILSGKTVSRRFAGFIYAFAVWDIFYYVFLKLMIGWPESFLTWDLLFLIPTTWTGPVITPVLVSLTMIFLAMLIFINSGKGYNTGLRKLDWIMLSAGSLVLILSFVWDYSSWFFETFRLKDLFTLEARPDLYNMTFTYIPRNFPWVLFITGEVILLLSIFLYGRRIRKTGLAS